MVQGLDSAKEMGWEKGQEKEREEEGKDWQKAQEGEGEGMGMAQEGRPWTRTTTMVWGQERH